MPPDLAARVAGWSGETVLAGDAGATVWRLTAPDGAVRYLKWGDGQVADDVGDEAARLGWLQGRVPCAALLGSWRDGDRAWLLTEAVAGRVAGDWLRDDPAALTRVVAGLAQFVRRLHALPADDCPFDASVRGWLPVARRRVAEGLVDEEDFDDDHAGWTAGDVLAQVEALAPFANGRVVVHGDLTLGNLLLDAAGEPTGCIDVGRMGIGDPYQDIALLWRDLGRFGDGAQQAFMAAMGIAVLDRDRLRLHLSLDELF